MGWYLLSRVVYLCVCLLPCIYIFKFIMVCTCNFYFHEYKKKIKKKKNNTKCWKYNNVKIFGMDIDYNQTFKNYVSSICTKVGRKRIATRRIFGILNFQQKRILMKSFFCNYCRLVCLFYSRQIIKSTNFKSELLEWFTTIKHLQCWSEIIYLRSNESRDHYHADGNLVPSPRCGYRFEAAYQYT